MVELSLAETRAIIAAVLAIVFAVIFFVYGLPALRGIGPSSDSLSNDTPLTGALLE
jgi:hypothetical protein